MLSVCPNVLIEFWNEPSGGSVSGSTPPWVQSGFLRCIQNITTQVRNLGVNNILIAQWDYGIYINYNYPPSSPPAKNPNYWANATGNSAATLEWVKEFNLNGTNIVYDFHDYPEGAYLPALSAFSYSQVVTILNDAWVSYVLNTLQKPLICGEIGYNTGYSGTSATNDLNDFNYTLTAFRNLGVGFTTYCLDGAGGGGTYAELTSYYPNWSLNSGGTIAKWNLQQMGP